MAKTYNVKQGTDADLGVVSHRGDSQILTATGPINYKSGGTVQLQHATVLIAATLAAPKTGDELTIVNSSPSGVVAHTVTLPAGVAFDAAGHTIATFAAPDKALVMVALSPTRWFIKANLGAVALS